MHQSFPQQVFAEYLLGGRYPVNKTDVMACNQVALDLSYVREVEIICMCTYVSSTS